VENLGSLFSITVIPDAAPMVDEIGCINIWAFEDLDIDPLGKGNTIHITKDKGYCMDGATLLAYMRNRKTQGGDVDRARRTQQAIIALKDAVLDPANLPTLLSKAPALYRKIASDVKTNLSFDDAMKLAMLLKDISPNDIKNNIINYEMATLQVFFLMMVKAMSILAIPDKIRRARDQMFAESGSIKPFAQVEPAQLAVDEGASLEVLNGTFTAGLAGKTGDYFKSLGMNVAVVGNPEQIGYPRTVIIDHSGKPYMTRYLMDLFKTTASSQFQIKFDPASPADVTVILGDDWAFNNPMP
jgi:hypothetical protein